MVTGCLWEDRGWNILMIVMMMMMIITMVIADEMIITDDGDEVCAATGRTSKFLQDDMNDTIF